MATPKRSKTANWLEDFVAERRQAKIDSPVVQERWWVVDYWPPRHESDEYSDYWTDSNEKVVSPFFYSLEAAEKFVNEHDPAEGAELKIKHQNKRRITREEWVNW